MMGLMDNHFKAPEGTFECQFVRNSNAQPFHYQRSTRISLAILPGSQPEDGPWIVYNVGDLIYLQRPEPSRKV